MSDLDAPLTTLRLSVRGEFLSMSGNAEEYVFSRIETTGDFYERELLDKLASIPFSGPGIVVDGGANIGNHTVYLAHELQRQVIAIEPISSNLAILQKNVADNGLGDNVRIEPVALWSEQTRVRMHNPTPGNDGTHSVSEAGVPTGIHALPLDQIVGDQRTVLLKLDLEGSEAEALKGALTLLQRDRPVVVVEVHDAAHQRSIDSVLAPLGYSAAAIAGVSDNYLFLHPDSPVLGSAGALAARLALKTRRELQRNVAHRFDMLSRSATSNAQRQEAHIEETKQAVIASREVISSLGSRLESLINRQTSEARLHHDRDIRTVAELHQGEQEALRASIAEARHHGQTLRSQLEETEARLQGCRSELDHSRSELERLQAEVKRYQHLQCVLDDANAQLERSKSDSQEARAELERLLDEVRRHEHLQCALDEANAQLERSKSDSQEARANLERLQTELERFRADVERARTELELTQSELENARAEGVVKAEELTSARASLNHVEEDLRHRDQELRDLHQPIQEYQALVGAFSYVNERLGELDASWEPDASWDALGELSGVQDYRASAQGRRELVGPSIRQDRVRIGIASMPGREDGLRQVLERLTPQADEIFVYLNGYESVPPTFPAYPNIRYFTGLDHGDRGKFLFMEGFSGYYLTCDDDIAYPNFYVDHIVDGIERYSRQAIVGWHGSIFLDGFSDYYDANSRRVVAYYSTREAAVPVHLVGTGICGFHTSTIQISETDFKVPNMGDVWLALAAQRQRVPMVVLPHKKGWAEPIDRGAPSISNASIKKEGGRTLDVRHLVTQTVLAHPGWKINRAPEPTVRPPLRVGIVGRTDAARWKKGGILKSTHLMVDMLARFGTECQLADIETGDPMNLEGFPADIVIIYTGDPERPDFVEVEKVIVHHMQQGRCVIVNLSIQGDAHRSTFVADKLLQLDAVRPGYLYLMTFTESARAIRELAPVAHKIVTLPKTLVHTPPVHVGYGASRGVFVGDIAKLSDSSLLGGDGREWIAAIRKSLPGVPLFGVQQYKPRYKADFDLDEVWPFSHDGLPGRLAKMRLMVAPTKFATYEMVPMEVAGMGIPVVYRPMPQSLSEALGLAGVQVDSSDDLEGILPLLYHDPVVWRSFSRAALLRAHSQDLQAAAGQTLLRLTETLMRARRHA